MKTLALACLAALLAAPAAANSCDHSPAEGAPPRLEQLQSCWSEDLTDAIVASLSSASRAEAARCLAYSDSVVSVYTDKTELQMTCATGAHQPIAWEATVSEEALAAHGVIIIPDERRVVSLTEAKRRGIVSLKGEALLNAIEGSTIPAQHVQAAAERAAAVIRRQQRVERLERFIQDQAPKL